MHYTKIFIALILISLPGLGWAQNDFTRFRVLNVDDGMSQNTGFVMQQDSVGYMWIGTQLGLDRYSGNEFKNFRFTKEDSTSLSEGWVMDIHIDSNNQMWVGTLSSSEGVNKYSPKSETFKKINLLELITGVPDTTGNYNRVWNIEQTVNDKLWLGTEAGLAWMDVENMTAQAFEYAPGDTTRVKAVLVDSSGELWFGDKNGDVWRIRSNESTNEEVLVFVTNLKGEINDIIETDSGEILIGSSENGLQRIGLGSEKVEPYLEKWIGLSEKVNSLYQDRSGNLWIGTNNLGLVFVSPNGSVRIYNYKASDAWSLPDNTVYSLYSDDNGTVWAGTWNGIAVAPFFHNATELHVYSEYNKGLRDPAVLSFLEYKNNTYWLGKVNAGLSTYEPTSKEFSQNFTRQNSSICGERVYDIEEYDEKLWIATHDRGLCTFDPKENEFFHYSPQTNNHSIRESSTLSLLEDSFGDLWIGLRTKGISVYNKTTKQFRNYFSSDSISGLPGDYIWPIIEDFEGNIWLGVFGVGIASYNRNSDSFQLLDIEYSSDQEKNIYDLYRDSEGFLWAATDAGAKRINLLDRSVITIGPEQGLPNENIRGIVEDEYQRIWLTTNKGLTQFDLSDESIKNFFVEDGMQGNRYFARSVLKASDGRLFFGGDKGFQIIDPALVRDDTSRSNIVITRIIVNGEEYVSDVPAHKASELILEPDENQVQIFYSLLNFASISKHTYRYRLLKSSLGWNPFKGHTQTRWVNLANQKSFNVPFDGYGDYVLEIVGANGDGVLSRNTINLAIRLKAYWWQTTWFKLLLILGAITLITGFVAVRLRHRLNIEKLRVSLAKKLHDDINGDLSTIGKRIRILKKRLEPEGDELKHLTLMNEMVQGMGDSVRDNTWLIDTREDTLKTLVEKMQSLAHMKLEGNVAFSFHQSPDVMPDIMIKLDFKQHIFMLYKESLNNIIKYAQAGQVTIEVQLINKQFLLKVKDDGIGFDEEEIRRGDGLENMTYRASQIKAHFEINSRPGCGTEVILQAPVQKHLSWELKLRSMLEKAGIL